MGGEAAGTASIERAVRERVERGVDIVKVMVSGGVHTQGSDAMRTQFDTVDLAEIVALTTPQDFRSPRTRTVRQGSSRRSRSGWTGSSTAPA